MKTFGILALTIILAMLALIAAAYLTTETRSGCLMTIAVTGDLQGAGTPCVAWAGRPRAKLPAL